MRSFPNSKRAQLPRASDYTKIFLKDWERLSRSGRYDLKRLEEACCCALATMHRGGLNGWSTR
jgi:hypothetical protein